MEVVLMAVTEKDVKNVAKLARIKVPDNEIQKAQKELNAILNFFEKLKSIDTMSVEDAIHPTDKMPERHDVCKECNPDVMNNAPETVCNMFAVPKVME